jgi:hypothetical protein
MIKVSIEVDFIGTDFDWILLAQDVDQWPALMITNGIFWLTERLLASEERFFPMSYLILISHQISLSGLHFANLEMF